MARQRKADATQKQAWHQASVMSSRQAARIKNGQVESKPDDYKHLVNRADEAVRQREARNRLQRIREAEHLNSYFEY